MAPKTKKTTPAQENVSLGPLAGDGMIFMRIDKLFDNLPANQAMQANSFSVLLVSSPLSMIPSSTLPISGVYNPTMSYRRFMGDIEYLNMTQEKKKVEED